MTQSKNYILERFAFINTSPNFAGKLFEWFGLKKRVRDVILLQYIYFRIAI